MITQAIYNISAESTNGNGRVYVIKNDDPVLEYYSARYCFGVPYEIAKRGVAFDTFILQYNAYSRMLEQINVIKTLLLYRLAEEQKITMPNNAIVTGVTVLNQVIDEAIDIWSREDELDAELHNIAPSGVNGEIYHQLKYISNLSKFRVDTYEQVKRILDKLEGKDHEKFE